MNSSQLYKSTIRRKRTYFWAFFGAAILFSLDALWGAYKGSQQQGNVDDIVATDTVYTPSAVPYEHLFRTYAPTIGWDWELLAAVAYHESRFNPNTISPRGAQGLMQIMPATGEKMGITDSTFFDPQSNIAAGCLYITRLQRQFKDIKDTTQLIQFVLASYNAGPAHIHDARRLAQKYGGNPSKFADVEQYMRLLSQPEYYTDSVVQYGIFKSKQTIAYVHRTLATYQDIRTGKFVMRPRKTAAANTAQTDTIALPPYLSEDSIDSEQCDSITNYNPLLINDSNLHRE